MTLDRDQVIAALPNYEIGGELGRGGWGVVLSGRHRQLGREVAIKQLPRAFAADNGVRARFTAEAQTLARLDHPHIVPVYDYVENGGICLLVMELLPQGTLWSRFTTEGITAPAAIAAVLACLAGLDAAHKSNVLHRDVKPENLMFSSSGALKVTDFGIAKVLGGEMTLATKAGEVVGTPAYIAPEQARGGELSPATDNYAVATMLYELLCGQLPFTDDGDAMSLLFKHAFEQPDPLSEKAPTLPPAIVHVVMAGLATDPAGRPATAQAFGLLLATACTDSWGPGWLPPDGTPVMGANAILAATQRASGPLAPPTVVGPEGEAVASAPPLADPSTAGAATVAPGTALVPAAGTGVAPLTVVRPPTAAVRARTLHTGSVVLADVGEPVAELVPVKDIVKPIGSPKPLFLGAAALAVVAVVLALIGLNVPSGHGSLAPGAIQVAGTDPVTAGTVTLDLSTSIPVTVTSTSSGAQKVQLASSVLGQTVDTTQATLRPSGAGANATLDVGGRYLVGGAFTETVTLLRTGKDVGDWSFRARNSQLGVLSLPAGITLLLLLIAIAYAESVMRSLRRAKRKGTGVAGLGLVGAVFGIALVGLAWVLVRAQPTVVSLVVCAVLGAGAGIAMGVGGLRIGRRRRLRRIERRDRARAGGVGVR